jgi:starch-binding outer membrane protein, SusD/RagB family
LSYQTLLKMNHENGKIDSRKITKLLFIISILFISVSCDDFLEPPQKLILKTNDFDGSWYEYRSLALGLYSLQQELVEQIVVLGELRGDLLTTTHNSSPELIEVNDFKISKDNPYASPYNFFRLIAACNSLIRQLKHDYPDVVNAESAITNYDRVYGEALTMRAWAYFNAVRIYGKMPYIYEALTSVDEIIEYVNSGVVVSEFDLVYGANGAVVDTIRHDTISLNRRYVDMRTVIDTFTYQLVNNVKAVGVNHSIINNDITWNATTWNINSMSCLLGEMYLYDQNYLEALKYFNRILYNNNDRFLINNKFRNANWRNIFSDIDVDEHIYTIWFDRSYQQTNKLQQLFSPFSSNQFMMKPTSIAVEKWETIWSNMLINRNENRLIRAGNPGDFHRGHRVSYIYFDGTGIMPNSDVRDVLSEKSLNNTYKVRQIMSSFDTAVHKFSLNKSNLDHDANFSIYRAADIHLFAAEIYARLNAMGVSNVYRGQLLLNDGSYNNDPRQLGVRGRVGFGGGHDAVDVGVSNFYIHNPYTNEIESIISLSGKDYERRILLADAVIDERARELAFEGKRFYDLMRVAKRRNDPSYLADKVAAKFSEPKKSEIRELLMNESNWYVNYFE